MGKGDNECAAYSSGEVSFAAQYRGGIRICSGERCAADERQKGDLRNERKENMVKYRQQT